MVSFEKQARMAIPSEVHMISGSMDSQTSSDVFNNGNFELPDPAGKAGGACTSALLKVLHDPANKQVTWVSALQQMRSILKQQGFDQIPQLTSSRMVNINKPLEIVPSNSSGTKRAVMIGINYVGQQGELRGCHNDVANMKKYLVEQQGFREQDIVVLMDDGTHTLPTKQNMLDAFQRVVEQSKSGDVVFVHYSGHGSRTKDQNGDEKDGYDETIIPLDFRQAGEIRDDDLLRVLVIPMVEGVTLTCLMDSCHSGTVLDLPYQFASTDSKMHFNDKFNFSRIRAASVFPWLNVMNLLAYGVNAGVTYAIGALGLFGMPDNATLSAKYQTLITPAGFTFGIWALIFIAELIWSFVQLLPAFRGASLVRRGVSWYWIGVCFAQIGWTVAFSMEIIWLSLVAMLSILFFLLLIVVTQYRFKATESVRDYVLLKWPFLVHCGWILAASMVNINVLLVDLAVGTDALYYAAVASLVAILGIASFALFFPAQKNLAIPLVLTWATTGIYVELMNPKDVIMENFGEAPYFYVPIQYGAIAVSGTILFSSVVVAICSCRNLHTSRSLTSTATNDVPPGGDYHNMADV